MLLTEVHAQAFDLFAEVAVLVGGICDLLDGAAAGGRTPLLAPTRVLERSVVERAAVALWLISDARDVRPDLDLDLAREFQAGGQPKLPTVEELNQSFRHADGAMCGRRVLVWRLDQLRHQRNQFRAGSRYLEGDDSLGLIALNYLEGHLLDLAERARWKVEPQRLVDGSWIPAHLARESGNKPERMPPLSDLVGEFSYGLLSRHAHPSWDILNSFGLPEEDNPDPADGFKYSLGNVASSAVCVYSLLAWVGSYEQIASLHPLFTSVLDALDF